MTRKVSHERPPQTLSEKLLFNFRQRRLGKLTDPLYDLGLVLSPNYWNAVADAAKMPARRVLAMAVDVPSRREGLNYVKSELSKSKHDVQFIFAPLGDRGKFDNIGAALTADELRGYDWLIVYDDDVRLPRNFLNLFLYVSERANFVFSQPVHKIDSYFSHQITRRNWKSLARSTRFVECGPLTAFHKSIFDDILPFPQSRYGWGLDILWAEVAKRHGLSMGVVDATPIEHTRPIAGSYNGPAAEDEMHALLATQDIRLNWHDYLIATETFHKFSRTNA